MEQKLIMVIFMLLVFIAGTVAAECAEDNNMSHFHEISVITQVSTSTFPMTKQINLSAYKPNGKHIEIQESNITVYETGSFISKKVLILIYDLFGLDSHFQYIADNLSGNNSNFSVIIPDFFRGHPYLKKNWPPRNPQTVTNFINRNGSWTRTVKNDLRSVFRYYKSKYSIESFGLFGYCWGGKMVVNAASDPEFSPKCLKNTCNNGSVNIRAIGLVHPSLVTTADANKITRPTIVLPSRDEINMIPFCSRIKRLQGPDACFHKRFTDMSHGFSGALSNWSRTNVAKRMMESIQFLKYFFQSHMN